MAQTNLARMIVLWEREAAAVKTMDDALALIRSILARLSAFHGGLTPLTSPRMAAELAQVAPRNHDPETGRTVRPRMVQRPHVKRTARKPIKRYRRAPPLPHTPAAAEPTPGAPHIPQPARDMVRAYRRAIVDQQTRTQADQELLVWLNALQRAMDKGEG